MQKSSPTFTNESIDLTDGKFSLYTLFTAGLITLK